MKSLPPPINRFRAAALLAAMLLGGTIASQSYAAVTTWQSTGSNSWSSAANWTGNAAPTSADLAVFDVGATAFAGPQNNTINAGGILLQGTRSGQTIQPYNNTTNNLLRLYGYDYTVGDETFKLLIGNISNTTFTFTNRAATLSFPVTLYSSGVIYAESTIYLGTPIGDGGMGYSITKKGSGILQLGDGYNAYNTFGGGFILEEGIVSTYASSSVTSGTLTASPFGTGALTLRGGRIQGTSANPRFHSNAVILDGGATFGRSATEGGATGNLTFNAAAGNSTTLIKDSELIVQNRTDWAQNITGDYSLKKSGVGTLILSNTNNTYTGATTVESGSLYVNGSLFSSDIEVKSGGLVGGSGSVYSDILVRSGATLAPGVYDNAGTALVNSRGTLKSYADITLEEGSTLAFRLDSTNYDKIYTEGTVDLGGATLDLTLTYQPLADDVFVLIQNEGFDPINGLLSYNGLTLTEGSLFEVTSGEFSQYFTINYGYSDNGYYNALALTASAIPEPSSVALLALASGAIVLGFRRKKVC